MENTKIDMFNFVDKESNHGGIARLADAMKISYDTLYHNFRRAKTNKKEPSLGKRIAIAKGLQKLLGRKVRVEDLFFDFENV